MFAAMTNYLLSQTEQTRMKIIPIMSLLDINGDPGAILASLTEQICARPLIQKHLLTLSQIKISPKTLNQILERYSKTASDIVIDALKGNEQQWDKESLKIKS